MTRSVEPALKVALVTGAGSGIGRAAALALARVGADVVLAGRRHAELLAVAQEVERMNRKALVVATDVSVADQVQALVRSTVERFGRLDVAFNNAGIEGAFAPIQELKESDFDSTIGINLKGAWLCCREEMAAMRRLGQGGAIVNTSSWLARGAFPGSSVYSASKAALDGMIRALAQEGADAGIRVNNVNPGIIDTPMLRRFGDSAFVQPFVAHTPARRLGTAEDVADVVVWLSSDASRFVTGQCLMVDGGYAIPGHRSWLAGNVDTTQHV
jgi:NAD(P)-dependent dehydrogenase (short-subunit alcohol dehydrogenase family)